MATQRLSLELAATTVVVAALALGGTVSLGGAAIERALIETTESRLRFTLDELRDTIQHPSANAHAALDAQAREDEHIVSISIIDNTGAIVLSTGELVMEPYPAPPASAPPYWSAGDGQRATLATSLYDDSGGAAGALVLHYDPGLQAAAISSATGQLWLAALAAALAAALCVAAGGKMLMRRMARTVDSMHSSLDRQHPHDAPGNADALGEQAALTSKVALHEVNAARDALSDARPEQ